jgi:hypothetical protein
MVNEIKKTKTKTASLMNWHFSRDREEKEPVVPRDMGKGAHHLQD